jgi:hypothetical protein
LLAAPAAVLQTNSDTGEQLPEPDRQRISWVVERLELTQQQQHSIARGMSVFKRLLSPVLEELRQLQQQGDACTSPCASNSTGMSGGAAACSGDAGDASQQYSSSSARRRELEQQEQRSARMKMLLRKVRRVCGIAVKDSKADMYRGSFEERPLCMKLSDPATAVFIAGFAPRVNNTRAHQYVCSCMPAGTSSACVQVLLTLPLLLLLLSGSRCCCRITSCARGSAATCMASCHGCSWHACT